jgi:hypothetical protein
VATRATPADVRKIMDTDDCRWPDLSPFVGAANNLVNQVCLTSGYSDATLKEIEKWLAAHFACQPDPRAQDQKIGESTDWFEGKTGMFLANTRYGQQAMILDSAGNLAGLNNSMADRKRRTTKFRWLGGDDCCPYPEARRCC